MNFHLPESFLSVYETLGQEKIVPILSVYGWDSPAIAFNDHLIAQPRQIDPAANLGKTA
jgi:hypothetical protein